MLGPHFTALPPLSLYIHIPWCVRKCPYCDFNSHERPDGTIGVPEREYIDALMLDLEVQLPEFWGRTIHTVFIGGGTPSLFSAHGIADILAGVRARTRLTPEAEITLEANPGTFEMEKFAGFRDAGVTRLSIGIQSFNDAHLQALGRIHDGAEARRAIEIGLATIGNVNLDLMFALPASRTGGEAQTMAECEADVRAALTFGTPHLSFYQLTLEPNTVFAKKPPPLPDHDLAADMQLRVEQLLGAAGYEHYETSAYARPGRRCQHNLNYWGFGDYLGIGAGAHGKLSLPAEGRVLRRWKQKLPNAYLANAGSAAAIDGEDTLSPQRLPFDFMLNALRLNDGVSLASFEARTGLSRTVLDDRLAVARERGWLVDDPDWLRPTPLGLRFANDVIGLFLD